MAYMVIKKSESRSFPAGDPFLAAISQPSEATAVVYLTGTRLEPHPDKEVVLVELGHECLGQHTGEDLGEEGSNVVGFARYRNGSDAPTRLVELVVQKNTHAAAIDAARTLMQAAGFTVAVCGDQSGRIIDRLVRPKYNAALRLLDESLASQKDIDLTCRLGLGYQDGPIERVVRGGLEHHYAVCKELFETYGTSGFAPARRAVVAARRQEMKS
ncbi:3-hydroxybutyryl-CoA dehydrogenase (plasmid) [Aminobacter sp. Y103A]|jgi:3-hydroxybutyryl-CoA dehydrogenase|uniref:3-hydroxybutyryl-CoA dehydrogenase n=1 Tax=Aminobacter aminovorans TaxID=83263 RepID=A0AAC9FER9_AMIAI|nr:MULTISPECIES: 3-hydroxyacyl-CoA dehydrogenase family protein [Aminobacter]AMS45285.1 3-hydroxybutyryl-CoA dehydrogenase [Aminobacter aminovorans]MBB3704950.1 3-hydroxybutyryl-CoA dehydrogenase [Aminobacter aminovorans]BBD41258.1 3-hydroxybutyryl-CoA dehydrogenase [Aminobacter sp. SS-2016]